MLLSPLKTEPGAGPGVPNGLVEPLFGVWVEIRLSILTRCFVRLSKIVPILEVGGREDALLDVGDREDARLLPITTGGLLVAVGEIEDPNGSKLSKRLFVSNKLPLPEFVGATEGTNVC